MKKHVYLLAVLFVLFTGLTFAQEIPTIDDKPWDIEKEDRKMTKQLAKSPQVIFKGGLFLNPGDGKTEPKKNKKRRSFGGLSAIQVSEDGQHLIAISDFKFKREDKDKTDYSNLKSRWFQFELDYDTDNRLVGAKIERMGQVNKKVNDRIVGEIESIAVDEGFVYMGSDGSNEILKFPNQGFSFDTPFTKREKGITISPWGKNDSDAGIEAMTLTKSGKLLAIYEEYGEDKDGKNYYPHTTWLINPLTEEAEKVGEYFSNMDQIKGATTLINGDVIVLEKNWDKPYNEIKLVLIPKEDLETEGVELEIRPSNPTILWLRSEKSLDNFEGITSYVKGGKEYLLLISDDNGDRKDKNYTNQRTLLLHLSLIHI